MNARHRELVDGYCSGSLSDAEFAELEEALRESPQLRRLFVEYRAIESSLGNYARAADLQSTGMARPSSWVATVSRWRKEIYAMASLIAVVLTGIAFLTVDEPAVGSEEQFDRGVAIVSRSLDADWVGTKLKDGDSVPPGMLALQSGFVELEFYSGASVILEGPAELEVLTPDKSVLHRGKLRADVPPHAHGFTIVSADIELVDLGTTFGMEVGDDMGTAMHVFDGVVEIFDSDGVVASGEGIELVAGESRLVRRESGFTLVETETSDYLDPREFSQRENARMVSGRAQWREHAESLRRDDRLLAHYDFGRDPEQPRRLLNGSQLNLPALDGSIIGAKWSEGRWPDKAALDFKRPGDRVRITVPETYRSVTLAAWVRIDGFDNRYNSLLLSDGWHRTGALHWQILNRGLMELSIWTPGNPGEHDHQAHFEMRPSDFGRWMHLAVVYDGDEGTVSHFRDGDLIGKSALPEVVPIEIGNAQLGNWGTNSTGAARVRNFNGRIDDLIILGDALGAAEIAKMHAVGSP